MERLIEIFEEIIDAIGTQTEIMDKIIQKGEKFEVYITRENTHGRDEERIYVKSSNVKWLKDKKWKHIKSIIMLINNTTVHDNSVRYYFSSLDLPVKEFEELLFKVIPQIYKM